MNENQFEVIVLGAGAAGLIAALEVSLTGRSVAIVEARERTGGRIKTIQDHSIDLPIEMGAEFVHGKLKSTRMLLQKADTNIYKVEGDIWQKTSEGLQEQKDFIEDYKALDERFSQLQKDISVHEFIQNFLQDDSMEEARFTVKNYVEGYYAADTKRASTFALRDELKGADEEQFRIEGGYIRLVNYLEEQCRKNKVSIFLSAPAQEIRWQKDQVKIICQDKELSANKIIITVPVGVLQSGVLRFTPEVPGHMEAARHLGFGGVIKTILHFEEAFWKNKNFTYEKDLEKMGFLFSDALIPTWWTAYPKKAPILTGWSGGPHVDQLKDLSDDEILATAIASLSRIFSIKHEELNSKLKSFHVANWVKDPYCFGGYSYDVVNGSNAKKILKEAVEDTIYFAGEGLFEGLEIGTVEAALVNGRDTAHQVIASFKN